MNKASKPRPSANDTPTKVDISAAAVDGAENGAAAEEGGDAPLLRAKQSQARGSHLENSVAVDGGAPAELDIAFISVDTIKSLFDFMHVEAGDEGERNIDQVLAAQSSLEGRGRPSNQVKRGLSKEPVTATAAA